MTHTILTLEISTDLAEALAERIDTEWNLPVIQLERPNHNRAWLEMYFNQPGEAEIARAVMAAWPEVHATGLRQESPRDWQRFWRHHFHAVNIGERLRIVPVWTPEAAETHPPRSVIWLDPGLSFGTGDHFTTRFCLERLDQWVEAAPAPTMLDVGTGSAILAIAARRLGASHCTGLDHDATALEQARENVRLNGLDGQIDLRVADILETPLEGSFDLVCANVYTTILLDIAPALVRCTAGKLALSGIRDPDLERVAAVYSGYGMKEIFRDGDGEWGGLAFEKLNGMESS